jgi:hypothetical protein
MAVKGDAVQAAGRLRWFVLPGDEPLIALSHHDEKSKTPANKSVPVRIRA